MNGTSVERDERCARVGESKDLRTVVNMCQTDLVGRGEGGGDGGSGETILGVVGREQRHVQGSTNTQTRVQGPATHKLLK